MKFQRNAISVFFYFNLKNLLVKIITFQYGNMPLFYVRRSTLLILLMLLLIFSVSTTSQTRARVTLGGLLCWYCWCYCWYSVCLQLRRHELEFGEYLPIIVIIVITPTLVGEMTMTSTFSELRVKHFLSLPRISPSGCITLLKYTFQLRLGHCSVENSVNRVLSTRVLKLFYGHLLEIFS